MSLKKVLLSRGEEERTQEKERLQSRNSYFMGLITQSLVMHAQMVALCAGCSAALSACIWKQH